MKKSSIAFAAAFLALLFIASVPVQAAEYVYQEAPRKSFSVGINASPPRHTLIPAVPTAPPLPRVTLPPQTLVPTLPPIVIQLTPVPTLPPVRNPFITPVPTQKPLDTPIPTRKPITVTTPSPAPTPPRLTLPPTTSFNPSGPPPLPTNPPRREYRIESRHFKVEPFRDAYSEYISVEKLREFIEVLDAAYEAGVELVGRPPSRGEKITLIDTWPDTEPDDSAYYAGMDSTTIFCSAASFVGILQSFSRDGVFDITMLHELGHCFTVDYRMNVGPELMANFIAFYMASKLDVPMSGDTEYGGDMYGLFEGKNAAYTKGRIANELEWARTTPDASNLLWLIYSPVLDAYGYKPFMDAFRNFPEGKWGSFTPNLYESVPGEENGVSDAATAHMFIATLSHFVPGGLESVVPKKVLKRFGDEWPATEDEGILAPYEGIYDLRWPPEPKGDPVGERG